MKLYRPLQFLCLQRYCERCWKWKTICSQEISNDKHRVIILLCEFFTPALAGSFSLATEGRQFSSYLQDPSEYSCRIAFTLLFFSFFSSLARSKYLSIFSLSSIFILCSAGTASPFFLINQQKVRSSDRNWMIHLYHKIPESFMGLILSDGFWFVLIPFGYMINFLSLA